MGCLINSWESRAGADVLLYDLVYIVKGTAKGGAYLAQPLAPPTHHAISPGHQGKDGEQIFTNSAKFWFIFLARNPTFSGTKSSEMESSYKIHSM